MRSTPTLARVAAGVVTAVVALLPLLSAACSNGNSCLRLSDCANGMTCQAGLCAAATPATTDADTAEGSAGSGGDANAQSQGSEPVDGGTATKDAHAAADADETDADTGNDGESSTQEADAG